ncbi:MAG TPA: thioredoxin domain-containing protein [Pyrinomonadaceae bacterium]|jgi:protein-disulfide isomerase|nr:thioredoxin domain-containing protein [Pyrinomonadaceae bacterium]
MNKNLPIFIIVIVLIAAIIGGVALFRNQGSGPINSNSNNSNKATKQAAAFIDVLNKAPQGASPAWTKGDPAAKITLEEFADFSCPTCANFHQTLKEIEKSYGQKIKITYRHFPLQIKGHENSYNAARAAEAAGVQGRFWEMQNMLFSNQKVWTVQSENDARNTFIDYAKSIGIDVEKFKEDMTNGQVTAARVASDMNRGKALDLNSTPSVILNGSRLLSNEEVIKIDLLRQAIESELQKSAAPPASNSNSNQNAQ